MRSRAGETAELRRIAEVHRLVVLNEGRGAWL